MFDRSKPKIGCSSSITNRWTRSSSFEVRKMMFEFVQWLIKMVFDTSLIASMLQPLLIIFYHNQSIKDWLTTKFFWALKYVLFTSKLFKLLVMTFALFLKWMKEKSFCVAFLIGITLESILFWSIKVWNVYMPCICFLQHAENFILMKYFYTYHILNTYLLQFGVRICLITISKYHCVKTSHISYF